MGILITSNGERIKSVVPNVSTLRLMDRVCDVYGADAEQAYYAVTSAAREMGYPRPVRDGIAPRDLFSLLRIVDRKLTAAS